MSWPFSFFSLFAQIGAVLTFSLLFICFVMGLLSLCEYVERRPNYLKKIVKSFAIFIAYLHIGFLVFERVSIWRIALSLLALRFYYLLILELPALKPIPALFSAFLTISNHLLWLGYFLKSPHTPFEVVIFYIFMVWAVPISIVVSYSTIELLPGFFEEQTRTHHHNKGY